VLPIENESWKDLPLLIIPPNPNPPPIFIIPPLDLDVEVTLLVDLVDEPELEILAFLVKQL